MNLNKIQIIGNVTKDPEIKALPSGIKVCSFSVATNRTWKDKNGAKSEEVEFHNVVAFGKQAELIESYVKKGSQLYVEGRLKTRTWETDGKKNYRTEIIMENMQFGARANNNSNPVERKVEQKDENNSEIQDDGMPQYPEDDINPDDIPF